MTNLVCERMRDRLPLLALGALDADSERETRAHVDACRACASELAVLRAVRGHTTAAPTGLDARIVDALQTRPPGGGWSLQRLAMAATVAFALVTAGLLASRDGGEGGNTDLTVLPRDWVGQDPPRILIAPGLEALSEDELLKLLEELDT